jgi:hypothetical protein
MYRSYLFVTQVGNLLGVGIGNPEHRIFVSAGSASCSTWTVSPSPLTANHFIFGMIVNAETTYMSILFSTNDHNSDGMLFAEADFVLTQTAGNFFCPYHEYCYQHTQLTLLIQASAPNSLFDS